MSLSSAPSDAPALRPDPLELSGSSVIVKDGETPIGSDFNLTKIMFRTDKEVSRIEITQFPVSLSVMYVDPNTNSTLTTYIANEDTVVVPRQNFFSSLNLFLSVRFAF